MHKTLVLVIGVLISQFAISAEKINWKLEPTLSWLDIGVNSSKNETKPMPKKTESKTPEPKPVEKAPIITEYIQPSYYYIPQHIYTQPRTVYYHRYTEYFCKPCK
jgi:hypothetical protein